MCKLERKKIERYSTLGWVPKGIEIVKGHQCRWVKDFTLTGDAPKEFVRVYHYEKGQKWNKSNPSNWPEYIAKTGHKWYPNESITEYLMNRLGEVFGLNMAKSRLVLINGQVRFLSRYFLRRGHDQLIHGAEIFAGYLEDDQFVEKIEEEGKARELFTLQFVENAVGALFPNEKDFVMHELVRLILFDALVGNNDRHFYNWGVIMALDGKNRMRFAPVYDTARGLFWNDDDEKVRRRMVAGGTANIERYLRKYCDGSRPKLGWDGDEKLNHFSLVRHIAETEFYINKEELRTTFSEDMLTAMLDTVDKDFSSLMIPERIDLVKRCLQYRFNVIKELMK